ncbi:hypothetical protein Tco_0503409 [Tanacetum coccineum]
MTATIVTTSTSSPSCHDHLQPHATLPHHKGACGIKPPKGGASGLIIAAMGARWVTEAPTGVWSFARTRIRVRFGYAGTPPWCVGFRVNQLGAFGCGFSSKRLRLLRPTGPLTRFSGVYSLLEGFLIRMRITVPKSVVEEERRRTAAVKGGVDRSVVEVTVVVVSGIGIDRSARVVVVVEVVVVVVVDRRVVVWRIGSLFFTMICDGVREGDFLVKGVD